MVTITSFDEEILAVRLFPHRSLDREHFRSMMVIFALASFVGAARFLMLGAWPVAGFFALDVLILYVAFGANYRAARAYEHYRLTVVELEFARVSPHGARSEWRFNPAWVRLERKEHEEFGLQRLALVSRGSWVEIAGFLGPDQKAEFAGLLSEALNQARRGPVLS